MMCDPCFMDANQVGYVHELSLDEVKKILDDAITIKPRRQMSVQFSGGEPTISPIFLEAVAYARQVGYFSVQARPTASVRAGSRVRARRPRRPGLRIAYLQFDGVGEEANAHRKVGNLFDVKLRAIENLHAPASTSRSSSPSSTPSTTIRSAGSSSSPSRTATRSASSPSSRFRSPAATKRSTTRRARGSATRCRTSPKT